MQHRFLPIFLFSAAIFLLGCGSLPEQMPAEAPAAAIPAQTGPTAAPTAQAEHPTASPAPTATPTAPAVQSDILAGVTAQTPIEEHPFYLAPVPTVRPDALPPVTAPPASRDREDGTVLTCGDYDYIRYDDGTAGLIGCHFAEPTHVFDLPETVDGIPITGLEADLAQDFEPATQYTPRNDIIIRIPKTVCYIGCNIAEAEMLHDITVEIAAENPYFQSVGNSIFSADGTLLHSYQSDPAMMHPQVYIVPETVRHIGDGAFYHCQELVHVQLPEGLRSIGAYAFDGCGNLSLMTLPASVETVGEEAFGGFFMTLYVQGNDTDLGTEPVLDAIAEIRCGKYAAAADYAKEHEIPHSTEAPLPIEIAIEPATRHLCTYVVQADGSAKILRIHSNGLKEFTVPESIGGCPVTALGYEALLYINEKHEDYPVRIRVPSCITSIDAGALWPETIMGTAGSAAERFAEDEGIEFVAE